MASPISFQGVSSGLKTDALVAAIMEQEGRSVQRMKDRQTLNTARATALKAIQSNLGSLSTSLLTLGATSFNTRTVTSSDASATYVSATASGAASGSYDLVVSQVATRGRLAGVASGATSFTLATATTTEKISSASEATFAVQGTDGVVKTLSVSDAAGTNNINGLRDAINASGAGVTATVVNTGKGDTPYQLVLTAKEYGAGATSTAGKITLADTTAGGKVNTIGIEAGTVTETGGVATGITNGTKSATAAQNAIFTLNGIAMERQSNTVSDAVTGVTFTLKKGGQDALSPTTLTVSQDKSAVTTAMQDVISKYNALMQSYKTASATTRNSDGSIKAAPLTGDATTRMILTQVRSILTGTAEGLPSDATYKSGAELGIKTNRDGTMSLDTTVFQAALDNNSEAVQRVFTFAGTSSNSAVSFSSATSKTSTGPVSFNISEYVSGGAITGTLTMAGQTYGVTGTNGVVTGPTGSPLEGLTLGVAGTGSGTLNLSRGVGQSLQDLVTSLTSYTGTFSTTLSGIDEQNSALDSQIQRGQSLLEKRKAALQLQFSQMEATISQLRAAGDSLGNLG